VVGQERGMVVIVVMTVRIVCFWERFGGCHVVFVGSEDQGFEEASIFHVRLYKKSPVAHGQMPASNRHWRSVSR
jgi:hypothetical protein